MSAYLDRIILAKQKEIALLKTKGLSYFSDQLGLNATPFFSFYNATSMSDGFATCANFEKVYFNVGVPWLGRGGALKWSYVYF